MSNSTGYDNRVDRHPSVVEARERCLRVVSLSNSRLERHLYFLLLSSHIGRGAVLINVKEECKSKGVLIVTRR